MKVSIDPQLSTYNNIDPFDFFAEETGGVALLDEQPSLIAEEDDDDAEEEDEEYEYEDVDEEDDEYEYEYEEEDEDGEVIEDGDEEVDEDDDDCLLYTSPSPRDQRGSRMPSSA